LKENNKKITELTCYIGRDNNFSDAGRRFVEDGPLVDGREEGVKRVNSDRVRVQPEFGVLRQKFE
jgi:hypothetical protein